VDGARGEEDLFCCLCGGYGPSGRGQVLHTDGFLAFEQHSRDSVLGKDVVVGALLGALVVVEPGMASCPRGEVDNGREIHHTSRGAVMRIADGSQAAGNGGLEPVFCFGLATVWGYKRGIW